MASPAALRDELGERLDFLREEVGAENVSELITTYLGGAMASLSALRKGLKLGDADVLEHEARQLKRSSTIIGAVRMAELCRQLAWQAQYGLGEKAGNLLSRIEEEFVEVLVALNAERDS